MSFPYVDHATEGSATACAILRMLNRYPGGCSVADLYRVTGIDIAALRDALAGLRQRHRVHNATVNRMIFWALAGQPINGAQPCR